MPDESIYRNHRLTRDGMKRQLAEGGSVLYRGPQDKMPRIIVREEDLPNDAELAGLDPSLAPTVHAQLKATIEAAQRQLELLEAQGKLAVPRAPADSPPLPADSPPLPPAPGLEGMDAPTDEDLEGDAATGDGKAARGRAAKKETEAS